MSLVQSRCRLDLVQHHLQIRFGREKSNKLSVIKLYWCQQQSFKLLLTNCGVQLRLHQRQLRKAAVGRSNMEPGLWPVAPDEFKSGEGGGTRPAQSAGKKFFVTVSTVWSVCCLQFTVPFGVGATVCGYALGGSDKSLTLAALTRLFGSGLPHTLVLCFNLLPLPPFFENSSDLHQSQDWPWRRLGGSSCPHPPSPRDDANANLV